MLNITRSYRGSRMKRTRLWLSATAICSLLVVASPAYHQRRFMSTQTTIPVTKGGWRPVVGSGSYPGFGALQAAPLHAPAVYKMSVPVQDSHPSSTRPLSVRDAAKMTSNVQQYRPTTLRNLPVAQPAPPPSPNQPINSYLNPFGFQNSGLSHYKIIQNFPMESVVIRNPHNPFAQITKYPTKFKQHPNGMLTHFNNVQSVQFGVPAYPTNKPHDNIFSKPVETYLRPIDSAKTPQNVAKPDPNAPEIYKTEVYKLPDSAAAPQSVNKQQVKTAQQQQNIGNLNPPPNPFQHHQFKEEKFAPLPPSLLGTFNTFGVQSVKGKNPAYPTTKAPYSPQTKQTIFNSFNYSPTFKTTPTQYISTTPKLQSNYNQILFGSTINDNKVPQVKFSTPLKTDFGPNKGMFKASPQDPFIKHPHLTRYTYQNPVLNKHPQVTTYNPTIPTTTNINNYFNNDFGHGYFPQQVHTHHNSYNTYKSQQNFNEEKKKHKVQDSFASSVNQPPLSQYPSPVHNKKILHDPTPNTVPFRATYDVTEIYGDDIITHSSPQSWSVKPDPHDYGSQQKPITEEPVTRQVYTDVNNNYNKLTTTVSHLPEEYAIVTESYDNSLSYDAHVDTQNKRPLGDDFEPIGKHKLKDYYYKVSTPTQEEYTTQYKITKTKPSQFTYSPTEPTWEYTTTNNIDKENNKHDNDVQVESLPTLPPNLHFKRPNAHEPLERDKIRKRNKNRRRRPPQANRHSENEEISTRKQVQSTSESYTTEAPEIHTIRPRVRNPNYNKSKLTTPSVTTDLSSSALPTTSPTTPTTIIIKKKIRRPQSTPAERIETTTISYKDSEINRESSIMKISNRAQHSRITTTTTEIPDYSHKQDEKDTPTSDIAVSISDTTARIKPEPIKAFSFHRDVKPIENTSEEKNTTTPPTLTEYKNLPENSKRKNNEQTTEGITTTPKNENNTLQSQNKGQRSRNKNKYESNRPRFSVKDYKNRLSYTTTTDKSTDSHVPKIRFPQRRLPFLENKLNGENDNSTDIPRKKFIPKDPRHKLSNTGESADPTVEKELHSRNSYRQRSTTSTTESNSETTPTPKISSRIRNSSRRPRPTEETTESSSHATVHAKRLIRKKMKDSEMGESLDIAVTETTIHYDNKDDASSERTHSESAIMKIAKGDKKYQTDNVDNLFEHSKRVSDLTLAASKDYNTPGLFKTVPPTSRRIPNYFTIATDDPILPIEAFFPQLNQKKES